MPGDARRTKPIAKLLSAAELDLDAARRLLMEPPNVLAANHLQHAAEKILGAVRLHRGLLNTKDHDLEHRSLVEQHMFSAVGVYKAALHEPGLII